jgi:DNA-binding LytR/AlgR family response regulator
MEAIVVIIVEDMQLIAEDISSKLKKHGMQVAGIYSTGEAALESLDSCVPDLILMDIQLAGALDGISTAKLIMDKFALPIIYLSDFIDNATVDRATKTLPANYLAKPFNESDLIRSINIAFTNAKESGKTKTGNLKDHVFVKTESGYLKLKYQDICYLQAGGAYSTIYTNDGKHLQTISMNHVLDQLDHKDFVRVHRSYAINVSKVTHIDGNVVSVGSYKVEMSKSMRDELITQLNFLK